MRIGKPKAPSKECGKAVVALLVSLLVGESDINAKTIKDTCVPQYKTTVTVGEPQVDTSIILKRRVFAHNGFVEERAKSCWVQRVLRFASWVLGFNSLTSVNVVEARLENGG